MELLADNSNVHLDLDGTAVANKALFFSTALGLFVGVTSYLISRKTISTTFNNVRVYALEEDS